MPDETVREFIDSEKAYNLDYYIDWGSNIQHYINKSREFIKELKAQGKTIYGFGAAAK